MKFSALILALIVLIQGVLPCTDVMAKGSGDGTAAAFSQSTFSRSHECQTPQDDCCSPFCQCGCCTGFAFIFHPLPAITPLPELSLEHGDVDGSSIIQVSLPIWQPPRLA